MRNMDGEDLRQSLERAGVTLEQIATRCGQTAGYVSGQLGGHHALKLDTVQAARELMAEKVADVQLLHFAVSELEAVFIEGAEDPRSDRGRELLAAMRFLLHLAERFFDRAAGRPLATHPSASVRGEALGLILRVECLRPLRARLITRLEGMAEDARQAAEGLIERLDVKSVA